MFLDVSVILFTGGVIPACIVGGIPACLAAGGVCYPSMPCSRGVPAPGGVCFRGGACSRGVCVWRPHPPRSRRRLLRTVRILLECILVYLVNILPGFVICARQLDRIVDIHLDFTLSNIKNKKMPGLRKYKEQKLYVRSKITIKIA